MTNFRLHDEQMVNGLRKIVCASIFCLKWQHIYIYIDIEIYKYIIISIYIRSGDTYNPDDVNILRYVTLRGFVNKI
jgi:hypothetical protein